MEAVEFGTFAHNGIIEIPVEYRESYSTDIRVILMRNQAGQSIAEPDVQERIAAAERLVGIAAKNSMTLEEIRNERLSRQ
jgi:allophanate hydrolase subunit 1